LDPTNPDKKPSEAITISFSVNGRIYDVILETEETVTNLIELLEEKKP